MNTQQKNYIRKIQKLPAKVAFELLMTDFSVDKPNAGEAFLIFSHRSWPKSEQKKLAHYYLKNIPHSSDKGYSALLKIMSLKMFIEILKQYIPKSYEDLRLLNYYVRPLLLNHAYSDTYRTEIADFLLLLDE